MRSRTGCQTCRQRKLKCDETKPTCGQCRKGSRECVPSDGVVFRHQQNASMNSAGGVAQGAGKLGGFYAYKNTFNEDNVWVDVPKNVTFLNITDPFNMEATPEPEDPNPSTPTMSSQVGERPMDNYFNMTFEQTSGLEALSTAATSGFHYIRPLSVSAQSQGEAHASPHSSNNLNFILNPPAPDGSAGTISPSIDPSLMASPLRAPEYPPPEADHEVAFLLRHFGETAGQWMDLFDIGCYFGHHVPVQALSNPLLRYSACAYAAKQLGRVRGKKAVIGGLVGRQADMEKYSHLEHVDWAYIGAKYYDKAISLLMEEVSHSGNREQPMTPVDETFSPQNSIYSPANASRTSINGRRRVTGSGCNSTPDETFASAAILCVYEFLDNASTAWSRHLSGTKSLFELAEKEGMMSIQSPTSPGGVIRLAKPSRARRSTFWNFARQDFLAAFINESQTRLNSEDMALWRAAGLEIDEQGFVVPGNAEDFLYPDRPIMGPDMISNALIWLMSKIINYIASGDSIDNVFPQNSASANGIIGINHMVLLQRWKELEKELDVWYQGLPNTFRPIARLPPKTDGSVPYDSPRALFSEIWYSIPMCAATMQSYYMARNILLINRPHESTARRSTLAYRLQSYRSIAQEVTRNSHEICSIALARHEGSVRIHQVQPLFVAGQCMTSDRERRVVIDLLRGIENDLGWATEYRVQMLCKEWGWNQEST